MITHETYAVLYQIIKLNQFPPALYDFKYFRYILHKDIKITHFTQKVSRQMDTNIKSSITSHSNTQTHLRNENYLDC